ncbi:hypothetical protein PPERSA_03274 [Pseudocohnilembus persalinus]|uniref:Proteasome subunit beta n=1 Tax=Pseudocohnilembus persalinus TaxID=266149 RepID=A0A0V0QZ29_PSEPJ|nr:hypothetical protein PPERSA_03274 [Pseudocohnilembus persalinus]|eukprot:KRX07441.1 hypothetical protein PPERSA_03274 [Pseudocohnilembus persalinus]
MGDPFSLNGGSMLGMKGENCVAIGTDRRLGNQLQLSASNFQRVFKMQDNILLGLSGLATDVNTFHQLMEFKLKLYTLRENRPMKVKTFIDYVSTCLYEKRFGPYFVSPIVVGMENGEPLVATYDSIGCTSDLEPFQCAGTGSSELLGSCESYWKKGLKPDELEEVVAQALVSGCDRDILSGWGGVVYVLTDDKLSVKVLKTKQC